MKEGWEVKKLVGVCSIMYGFPFESPLFTTDSNDGKPLIRIRDVKRGFTETYYKGAYSQEFIIKKGDFLIGMDGEFNIAPWQSDDALLNQRVCKIESKKESVLTRFLYYFLIDELKRIEDETSFITVKHLSAKRLNQIEIPLPPLPEQERIVSILDAEFAKIDAVKAGAEKSLQHAKDLFQAALKKELTPKEGWETKKLGEVIKLQSGENLPAKKMQDGIYPVYGGNGVSGYHNDYNMMGENIIIGRVGALCGNVRYLRDPFWLTDNGFKVILNKGLTVDLRYLTLFLNFANLRQYAKQTAQPVISNVALKEVPVILPPLPEQEQIVARLDTLNTHCKTLQANYERTIALCDDMKQALLRKAFNGEL